MRTRRASVLAVALFVVLGARAGSTQSKPSWDRLEFLLGTWSSDDPNELGSGTGVATFTEELDHHTMVRHSFADYKSGPQAGIRHDDLMVIYRETDDAPVRAIYFDSEGHVIRYNVTVTGERSVVFESEPSMPGPRYRLSYARQNDTLNGKFEIAPPGGDYKPYLTWSSRKR